MKGKRNRALNTVFPPPLPPSARKTKAGGGGGAIADDIGVANFSPVRQIFQCNLRAAPSRGGSQDAGMDGTGGEQEGGGVTV